eukprot:1983586-Pleurochrysis_carterae.AAC.1
MLRRRSSGFLFRLLVLGGVRKASRPSRGGESAQRAFTTPAVFATPVTVRQNVVAAERATFCLIA